MRRAGGGGRSLWMECASRSLSRYLTYSRSGAIGTVVAALTVVALSRHRWLAALHAARRQRRIGGRDRRRSARTRRSREATGYKGAGAVALALAVALAGCAVAAYLTTLVGVDRVRMKPRAARAAVAAVAAVVLVFGVAVGPALAREAWDSFHRTGGTAGTTGDPAQRLTEPERRARRDLGRRPWMPSTATRIQGAERERTSSSGTATRAGPTTSATRTRSISRRWPSSGCPVRSSS